MLNFIGTAVNAVPVNSWSYFGVAAAFGIVDFAKNEFKISLRHFLDAVRDAIQ